MKKQKNKTIALQPINDDPRWFTIKAAAKYLSIGEPTLYRWMRDGKITYRKIGDSTRFLQSDLEEVVKVVRRHSTAVECTGTCPACGSGDLEDGVFRSTGLSYFQPAKTKFFTLRDSSVKAKAMMCGQCGAIFLHGDTAKLSTIRKARVAQAQLKELPPGEDIITEFIENPAEDD
jgi:excisionase family DNA binding protein